MSIQLDGIDPQVWDSICVRRHINPVRRLVAELEKAHDELDDISSKLSRSNDRVSRHAELDLWRTELANPWLNSGASEAATRLRKAKGTIVAGEFDENLEKDRRQGKRTCSPSK